jgi:hypothetical protein
MLPERNADASNRPARKERKAKPQPATPGPKRRARIALVEVEDIVRRLIETHRYSPWLDTEEAAKYLCRQPGTLKGWRSRGEGPRFHVVNDKLIRYHIDDLDGFVRRDGR